MPFEIINQNEYLLIKLKGECVGDESPPVSKVFSDMMAQTGLKLVVIQASECGYLSTHFIRQLSQIYKDLKTQNGGLRMVGCSMALIEAIKNNGVDRILVNKMSLRGALVDLGLVKQKEFDVNFINPFLTSTLKVLKIQCFMEAQPQKPYLKRPTDPLLLGDISGIISVTSETFSGTLAISLSETIFCKIATNMLGEEIPKIQEDNVDLVGELANMILGQAKIELNNIGYRVQMALPSCVWGKDHKIKHFGGGVCVVIPFQTEAGIIYSEVMTNNNLINQYKKTAGASDTPATAATEKPKAA